MNLRFKGRDFLTLMDFSREEVEYIVDTAIDLKREGKRSARHRLLDGKTIGLLFEKPSTRTRVSFMAGIVHLGAFPMSLTPQLMQLSRGEPIKDSARVLDRYLDALVIRTFGQEIVEEYAEYMDNPVINALTDLAHPCQGLADLMTIWEKKGKGKSIKLAYAGDIWNVCQSLMVISTLFGFEMVIAAPKGYGPEARFKDYVSEHAGNVVLTESLEEALQDADVVYANTWHSMGGPEAEKEKRIADFKSYQVNERTTKVCKKDFVFMHCLPGYRGEEMSDGIIEGKHSVVWDQAENRMHTEKAVLALFVPP